MRTVLVTGGAGFVGSHIATALIERGDQVRILDDLSTGRMETLSHVNGKFEMIEASLLDRPAVARAVKGVDCIFHEAALASVPRSVANPMATHEACVTGTVTLLDEARKADVRRVIYAASSSAYGDQPYAAKRETDLPSPLSPYAAAKLACEHYCKAFGVSYGLETVCIRYFNVFGPRQDPDSPYAAVIPLFAKAMLAGEQPVVFADGLQSRDFTYVDNVVSGNLLAADAEAAAGRTINVACGRQTNLLDLIAAMNRLLGTSIEPIHQPPRAGDVRDSLADITLARKLLGYEPLVDFQAGLARSMDFYRSLMR